MENNNIDKYYIHIEPMFTQGVGGYHMVTSDITNAEVFRQELLKYKNYVEHNHNENTCGWVFYEYIYKIIDIKQMIDGDYQYVLMPIHEYEYEPDKQKFYKLKKVNWKKKIVKSKIETREEENLLKFDHIYNTITERWNNIALKEFNILLCNE